MEQTVAFDKKRTNCLEMVLNCRFLYVNILHREQAAFVLAASFGRHPRIGHNNTYGEAFVFRVDDATGTMKLYDSYIRAFRWSSDRIGDKGIISFVTNGGWLRGASMDGFRKCLSKEFN